MKCILILDDNIELLEYLKECFLECNFKVLVASNGKDGLKILKTNQIDFILTDIRMPEMDGVGFIKQVRLLNSKIPIIAMSGGSNVSEADILKSGANIFFLKPFAGITPILSFIIDYEGGET